MSSARAAAAEMAQAAVPRIPAVEVGGADPASAPTSRAIEPSSMRGSTVVNRKIEARVDVRELNIVGVKDEDPRGWALRFKDEMVILLERALVEMGSEPDGLDPV